MFRKIIGCSLIIVLLVSVVSAYGCSEEEEGVVTIKLGILGPLTGPVADPYRSNFWGLHDYFEYMGEEDPIPGVKFELIDFDTQYDSSKSKEGYDYVIDRGAMAIISLSSVDHEVLAPYTVDDEFPIFGHSATPPVRENPGWTFYDGCAEGDLMIAILNWIADEWDYDSGKPKIGAVGMNITTGKATVEAVEDYCTANPDKFEWVSGELASPTTTDWTTEVNRLKDCDYVAQGNGGSGGVTFVAQYIGAGGSATLLNTMVGVAGWSAIESLVPVSSLDGTIYISEIGCWRSDDFPILKKALGLIYENHSKADADYETAGQIGYPNAIIHGSMIWEIIKGAVAEYGAENLTSAKLYEYICAGINIPIEDYEPYTLSATDRQGQDYAAIYEYSADDADFLRISDWLPIG